jgi:hypothetical protein
MGSLHGERCTAPQSSCASWPPPWPPGQRGCTPVLPAGATRTAGSLRRSLKKQESSLTFNKTLQRTKNGRFRGTTVDAILYKKKPWWRLFSTFTRHGEKITETFKKILLTKKNLAPPPAAFEFVQYIKEEKYLHVYSVAN